MYRIVYVTGGDDGWAIINRAKRLAEHLRSDKLEIDILPKKKLPPNAKRYHIVHAQTAAVLKLPGAYRNHRCWGFELVSERTWGYSPMMVQAVTGARFAIGKNPELLRHFKGLIPIIQYIPNGVNVAVFKPRKFIVGWCGNKKPKAMAFKGTEMIWEACRVFNLNHKALGVEVIFLMDPSKYPGTVYPPKVISEWYRGVDVYASASKSEGCSNTILEAIATGLPVVTTKVGIWKQLQSAGANMIMVDRNATSIAGGIEQALQPVLSKRAAISAFTWQHVAKQYLVFYRKLGIKC